MTGGKKLLIHSKDINIMKIKIFIGVMLMVLFLINSHANIEKENKFSSPRLVVEAIMNIYPNTSTGEMEVLMEPERLPYGYEAENLEAVKKLELEMDRKENAINTESF
jgi:hypothetical protein